MCKFEVGDTVLVVADEEGEEYIGRIETLYDTGRYNSAGLQALISLTSPQYFNVNIPSQYEVGDTLFVVARRKARNISAGLGLRLIQVRTTVQDFTLSYTLTISPTTPFEFGDTVLCNC